METLLIKATKITPLVWFDASTAKGVMAGNSMPENANEFYATLFEWLDEHLAFVKKAMRWEFRLKYYNTSSAKCIYQLLLRIKSHIEKGQSHTIIWVIEDNDELIRESGEDFVEILKIPFIFKDLNEETARIENDDLNHAVTRLGKG